MSHVLHATCAAYTALFLPPFPRCNFLRRADAIGDEVVSEIIAATGRGPSNHDYGVGGHEAFTSIVFAPKVAVLFLFCLMLFFMRCRVKLCHILVASAVVARNVVLWLCAVARLGMKFV